MEFFKPVPAYVISETITTDTERMEAYKAMAPAIVASYGGRYLVRGGAIETLEGDWKPPRIVIIEFPSADAARRFYNSPEYQKARDVRAGGAIFRMVLTEGL